MDIYMSAPDGKTEALLTRDEFLELLGEHAESCGIVSEEPLHLEACSEKEGWILQAIGSAGRVNHVSIDGNPSARILKQVFDPLAKRGWEAGSE